MKELLAKLQTILDENGIVSLYETIKVALTEEELKELQSAVLHKKDSKGYVYKVGHISVLSQGTSDTWKKLELWKNTKEAGKGFFVAF